MNDSPAMQFVGQYSLGRRCGGQFGAVFLVERVEATEGRGYPVAPHLGHHHLEARMAVEHAAEHQLPQRSPATQVGEEVLVEHAATERDGEVHHVTTALLDLGDGRLDRAVRETLVEAESPVDHEGEPRSS